MKSNEATFFNYNALSRLPVPVGWGEAHHSWRERMTSIYPIICKLKIPYSIVYEMQSMIHCAGIPHGFAKGGLHYRNWDCQSNVLSMTVGNIKPFISYNKLSNRPLNTIISDLFGGG